MRIIDAFPTKFFEFFVSKDSAYNIINEILRNRDKIKIISSTSQFQSTDVYQTDFADPIKLESFEMIMCELNQEFAKYNLSFNLHRYWSAIYSSSGHHSMHNHSGGLVDRNNYSGILYLSDLGCTKFFSDSPNSFDPSINIPSETGKIVMFPLRLPHCYEPNYIDINERFVVAFNGNLEDA